MQALYHKNKKGSVQHKPQKREVVLIHDPTAHRPQWQAGIVDKVSDRQVWVTMVERHLMLKLPQNNLLYLFISPNQQQVGIVTKTKNFHHSSKSTRIAENTLQWHKSVAAFSVKAKSRILCSLSLVYNGKITTSGNVTSSTLNVQWVYYRPLSITRILASFVGICIIDELNQDWFCSRSTIIILMRNSGSSEDTYDVQFRWLKFKYPVARNGHWSGTRVLYLLATQSVRHHGGLKPGKNLEFFEFS